MLKLYNHNIILPKYFVMVKKKGSSLTFSAQGGWGKEKNPKSAKKISAPKRGRLGRRGSGGGMPSRPSVEAPPHRPNTWRAEPSRNIFFSLIEKNSGARAKKKIVKKMFLRGCRRSDSRGGRRGGSVVALSEVSSNFFVKTPPDLICAIGCLDASRLGRHFVQIIPRFLKRNGQHARREAAVPKQSLDCAKGARADERFLEIVGVSAAQLNHAIL